ncbi:MAG: DUF5719 family protein [Acidimicrobiales bacterium]
MSEAVSPGRRWAALGIVVGAIALGGGLDRLARPTVTVDETEDLAAQVPIASPPSAGSSAWFCAGATARADTPAEGTVVVVNTTEVGLQGTVTALGVAPLITDVDRVEAAPTGSVALTLGPYGRSAFRLRDLVDSPFAAAVVELNGGGVVVDLTTSGPLGESATPCVSSASPTWHFAEGSTARDVSQIVSVANPFADGAIIDLRFATDEGVAEPVALEGLAVPARSMVTVDVGQFVQRRNEVSTTVVARTGRVVAGRLLAWDGSSGRRGVSVTMGATAAGTEWYFPDGLEADGVAERFSLFNPGSKEAEVELALAVDQAETEPLALRLAPRSRLTVAAADQTRIPRGTPHSVIVTSTNGEGVVAERIFQAGTPSNRRGLVVTLGARLSSRRWAVAAGGSGPGETELVVVYNPGPTPANVEVATLVDGTLTRPAALGGVTVGPGQRTEIKVSDTQGTQSRPLLVSGSAPIVVERLLHRPAGAPAPSPPPTGGPAQGSGSARPPLPGSAAQVAIALRDR